MYRKALTLTLLGILVMGVAAIGYGTAFGGGFVESLGAVLGQESEDDDHDRERHWRDRFDDDDD